MHSYSKMNLSEFKYFIVGLAIAFVVISFPMRVAYSAFFEDTETSPNNTFAASNLDLQLNTDLSEFEETNPSARLKVKNNGQLDFIYEIIFSSDDSAFSESFSCDLLMVEVWYNGEQIFIGYVQDFEEMYDTVSNDKLELSKELESDEFKFSFFLPEDAPALEEGNCLVAYNIYAWQKTLEPFVGFWDEETLSFDISEDNLKNNGNTSVEELTLDEVNESTESISDE